jgi:hypothetical protein
LHRTLEILSLPAWNGRSPFWNGLLELCRSLRVTNLELRTFGSPAGVELPDLVDPKRRQSRCEFVWQLGTDPDGGLSSNHRRNLKKARKAGLSATRTRALAEAVVHANLCEGSLDRRRSRGETIRGDNMSPEVTACLESGAGELFQARIDDQVLSSVLVLRAPAGAYYQSAGTSDEGRGLGASHYLIWHVGRTLAIDGITAFNLGGAEPGSSLARFKEGFGTVPVALPAATVSIGARWRHWLTRGISLVSEDPRIRLRTLRVKVERPTREHDFAVLPDPGEAIV